MAYKISCKNVKIEIFDKLYNKQKLESFYMIFYTPFEELGEYLRYLLLLTLIRHRFAEKIKKNLENKKISVF